MKRSSGKHLLILFLIHLAACGMDPTPDPGPGVGPLRETRRGLPVGSTFEVGLDPNAVNQLLEEAEDESSSALVVLADGLLVVEDYFGGQEEPLVAMSASKSFVSLAIGFLIDEGAVSSLDVLTKDVFVEWVGTDKETITLRQMLTHTSGLDQMRTVFEVDSVTGEYSLGRIRDGLDSDLLDPPGTTWRYNNNAIDLLALYVGRVAGQPLDRYLEAKLFAPLDIRETEWMKDLDGVPLGAGELSIQPLDMAKVGQMLLDGGQWQDQQIISPEWIEASFRAGEPLNPMYGLLWWKNAESEFELTADLLAAWVRYGLPQTVADELTFLVGQRLSVDDYSAALLETLEPDALDILQTLLFESRLQIAVQYPIGRQLDAAQGWLGQYLVLDAEEQIVGVRMREPTAADYQATTYEIDGFPNFWRRIRDLRHPEVL